MNLFFEPLRKYAQFNGRARRREYWPFTLVAVTIRIFFELLALAPGEGPESPNPFVGLSALVTFALLLPSLAVGVRRLHDTDRSGWWILIGIIPILGWIALIILLALDGTRGRNRFGPDPKGSGEDVASIFA